MDLQLPVHVQSAPIIIEAVSWNPRSWRGVLDATLCDKVCQRVAAGWWLSPGSLVSSTNKTDHHDITEILLNVALNTIKQTNKQTNNNEVSRAQTHIFAPTSVPVWRTGR